MQHVNIMASLFISASRPSSRLTKSTKEQKPGGDKMNNKVKRVWKRVAGLEIATHWSPMRPKIECWRLDFHNWSPAGDSRFVR